MNCGMSPARMKRSTRPPGRVAPRARTNNRKAASATPNTAVARPPPAANTANMSAPDAMPLNMHVWDDSSMLIVMPPDSYPRYRHAA